MSTPDSRAWSRFGHCTPLVGGMALRDDREVGQSPFCFVFFTTTRAVIEVGGALPESAKNALQMMPLFAVARTRAEPFEKPAPKELLTESPTAAPVPKSTVAPAATLSDVALGSFAAAPPAGPKTSIPTRMGAPVVFVQGKKVSRPPIPITPGTDQRWKDACPWSAGGGESIWACTAVARKARVRVTTKRRSMVRMAILRAALVRGLLLQ